MNLGNAIRALRKEKGLNQKKFSELCKISQTYLSQIENNKKTPNLSVIEHMGNVIGIPIPVILFLAINEEDIFKEKRHFFNILSPSISKFVKEIFFK